ncbi:MAG: glycosyltransferase family 4 protein [Acidimicrobiales bacterium]
MRIAIVGTELCAVDARGGGLEQVLRRWAAELTLRHEVVLVSHLPGGRPLVRDEISDCCETVTVTRTAELDGALRRIHPDAVSLHNRPQWVGRCDPAALVGVTFHNYATAWGTRRRAAPPARLSAVSGALAGAVAIELGVGRGDVTVVPPSIGPAFCTPIARRPTATVLAPSRLLRKKGVVELLEVARRPEFADVQFEFADLISPWLRPSAEHRQLRAEVRSTRNACLFAPAAPAAMRSRYDDAGVVACPAQEPEGLGLVPLEAQACGAPVVTTDTGGLREATMAPNACVPVGDGDALAVALTEALTRVGVDAAREAVLARYAPATSAVEFERWLVSRG